MEDESSSTKVKYSRDITATVATISSLAKKAREPAPMKEVKRTNVVVINPNQWAGFTSRQDPYAIDVNRGRNCYSYGGFGHLVRNCKNKGIIEQGRKL